MVHFFHVRCACNIVNMIFQCGFNYLQGIVYKIRGMINFVYGPNRKMQDFGNFCQGIKNLKEQNLKIH